MSSLDANCPIVFKSNYIADTHESIRSIFLGISSQGVNIPGDCEPCPGYTIANNDISPQKLSVESNNRLVLMLNRCPFETTR